MVRPGRSLRASLLAVTALAACGHDPPHAPVDAGTDRSSDIVATDGSSDIVAPDGTDVPQGRLDVPAPVGGVYERAVASRRVRVTVYEPSIVRVQYHRDRPHPDRGWTALPLAPPTSALPFVTDGDEDVARTGALTLRIHRVTGNVTALDGSGRALSRDVTPMSAVYPTELVRALDEGERIAGLGEKTGALDRRGRRLTMWNSDVWAVAGGRFPPDTDPLYLSVPFFASVRGETALGTYIDNTSRTVFDVGRSSPNELRVSVSAGDLSYWLLAGPTLPEVIARYTQVTGRPPMPPRWSLGYHQSRWSYAPESALRDVARELRARDIPCDALWLDIDHMNGFRSFTWDRAAFPDPQRTLADLAREGLRAVAIIDPGLKRDEGFDLYREGVAGGHFATRPDGSVYHGRVWPGDSAFPDFTRPATRDWWAGLMGRPERAGLAGAWIDMNEPTVFDAPGVPEDLRADGEGAATDHREAHNVYALLMAQATREGLLRAAPDRRPFVLTRAGFAGVQRHAAVWTGDTMSTWDHLALVPAMLSGMSLSGIAFVGSDAGGYSGGPSAELFVRWMQVAALSPFFRNHVQTMTPRQEPWSFGPEAERAARDVIRLRYSLMPYLYALFRESSETGAPVLRPMAYEFPGDPASWARDDQFMLGPHLLVAPVLLPGNATRVLHLPAGGWTSLSAPRTIIGPRDIEVEAPLDVVPIFVRANAIVPRVAPAAHTGLLARTPTLDLYPVADAPEGRLTLYDDDGESMAFARGDHWTQPVTLRARAEGAALELGPRAGSRAPPPGPWVLRVHNVAAAPTEVRADGRALDPSRWSWDRVGRAVTVTLDALTSVTVGYDARVPVTPQATTRFDVTLPAGTPMDAPLYVATSVTGWRPDGVRMTRLDASRATASVTVEEGTPVGYKYTRGTWATVERAAGCAERPNRAVRAGAGATADTVVTWADRCP